MTVANWIEKSWKAIVAFVTPGVVVLSSAILATSDGGDTITSNEWITALVASLVSSVGVWTVRQKPWVEPQIIIRDTEPRPMPPAEPPLPPDPIL